MLSTRTNSSGEDFHSLSNRWFAWASEKLFILPANGKQAQDDYRAAYSDWLDTKRPVIETISGFHSRVRIDGPVVYVAEDLIFPMGSFLETETLRTHLDGIDTSLLEERLRTAIDEAIAAWVIEAKLTERDPPISPDVDRATADPTALENIARWTYQRRPGEPMCRRKFDA